jgi:hypothetical protein
MNDVIVGIDPSVRCLGISIIDRHTGYPHYCGLIKQEGDAEEHARSVKMAMSVASFIRRNIVRSDTSVTVAIEVPSREETERGKKGLDSGNVQQLYFTAGCIAAACASIPNVAEVVGAIPIKWKGQTPKPIMIKRAATALAKHGMAIDSAARHDAAEAYLIAHSYLTTPGKWKPMHCLGFDLSHVTEQDFLGDL